jgi:molybdopterin-guanine dinucleotide biosynthesis protein A
MTEKIFGVVLAGGRSVRMQGENKSFQKLGGKTLLDRVIERALPQVDQLLLNSNDTAGELSEAGLTIIADSIPAHAGPLAGLLAAMEFVAQNHSGVSYLASFPVDSPFYPKDLVSRLVGALELEQASIAIPRYRNRAHWAFGVWSVALLQDLRQFVGPQGQRKVQDWVERHAHCFVDFDESDQDPFFNINTPTDLKLAQARLQTKSL